MAENGEVKEVKEKETKEKGSSKKLVITLIIALVVILAVVLVIILSKKKEEYRTIKVNSMDGSVDLTRDGDLTDIINGMSLLNGDKIAVKDSSLLELLADSDKHIVAKANTTFSIKATGSESNGNITINVEEGDALFTIDKKLEENSTFEVNTPNASLSVRGTTFEVMYDKSLHQTHVMVTEGVVKVWTNKEEATLEAGDEAYIVDEEITTNDDAGSGTGDGTTPGSGDGGTDVGTTDKKPGLNWYNFEEISGEWAHDKQYVEVFCLSFTTAVVDMAYQNTDLDTISEIVSLGEVSISELDKYPWYSSNSKLANGYDDTTFCGDIKSIIGNTTSFADYEKDLLVTEGDGHIYISEIELSDDNSRVTHMILKLGGTDAYCEYISN